MDNRSLLYQLLEVTNHKKYLLKSIYELTCKQAETIALKQLEGFLSLVSEKQKLIEKINDLDNIFDDTYKVVKDQAIDEDNRKVMQYREELQMLQLHIAEVQHIEQAIKEAEADNNVEYKKMFSKMMSNLKSSITSRQQQIAQFIKFDKSQKKP